MEEVKWIEIECIHLSPYQPRKNFISTELEELAQSIKAVGLIHPPTVRALGPGEYELLSGERRLRASKLAGLQQIPVYIREAGKDQSAHAALIENIQRVDLNPLEIAFALKKLIDEFGSSQEVLAKKIGKKRSTVANYLRLLSLPEAIQQALKEDVITMGHAKAILSLNHLDQQMNLYESILRQSLSVRSAEEAARQLSDKKIVSKPASKREQTDIFLMDLEKSLSEKFSTRVTLLENKGKGVLSLHFYSLDDLDRLLEQMSYEK